ncbi:MAG TPA: glycosyltransferase [Candidatus Krumholzibacteria bacterium]|nr:glycosyltransferase [Candidatus Krumholzibacteria bacterium]
MTPLDRLRPPRLLLLGDARQVHLRRWAAYFAEHGYDVLAVSLEPGEGFPTAFRRIRVTAALPDAVRYPLAASVVRGIAGSFRPDVVNAHFVPNYGMIAALVFGRRWVMSTWGSDVMTDPAKSAFHRWRVGFVLRRAGWVTSDAAVMTERIRDYGVPADRVLTFPYGVDVSAFHPERPAASNGPRIVTNRKLEDVYSVDTVIDAFAAVREALPDATLTVAGDGSLGASLRRRAERSPAAAAVTFVGAVDHARMPALLQSHHVYVSASRSDTTSVSLLEAMACGLFPVVTDIEANREWIVDGESGRLVPPGEATRLAVAIIDAWRDSELRERALRINLRAVEQRARWEETMRPVKALFDEMATGASEDAPAAVRAD